MNEKKVALIKKRTLYLRILEALSYASEIRVSCKIKEESIIPRSHLNDPELFDSLFEMYQRKLEEVCRQLNELDEVGNGY